MNIPTNAVQVWDPIVRYGHWVLVIAFFTAYLTEDDFLTLHVWAGYVVGTIVCIRFVWGFVGTKHARFADFVRSPAKTVGYLSDLIANKAIRYIGHSPAGGAMVVALLLSISATVVSGLVVYAIEEDTGPLAGWVANYTVPESLPGFAPVAHADTGEREKIGDERPDNAVEELWDEVHEILAKLTLLLVGLHICGVLFSSYTHKENLIRAMFTGWKHRNAE